MNSESGCGHDIILTEPSVLFCPSFGLGIHLLSLLLWLLLQLVVVGLVVAVVVVVEPVDEIEQLEIVVLSIAMSA